jgi:bifunctional non-homologous end joining protein LigD
MALPGALIDGEAVAFNAKGRSDFSSLQHALSEGGRIAFFAFDLLALDGADLTRLPLSERKQRLEALLSERSADGAIRFSTHIEGRGPEVFAKVCAAGEEGIVSKKASSLYRGERTHAWVKVKCTRRQEFVIGGWTPSEKRTGFRSLLLGVFEPDGSLRYVGRVGTGFDEKDLDSLGRELKRLAQPKPPFKAVPREAARRAKWAAPKLVAEIAFTEFTGDGILRHPSFLGLREDKQPREVGMEKPEPVEDAVAGDNETIVRAGIRITHPDRVVFGEQGLTKRDLADYYVKVAERMLPHLAKRPLSLVRCPAGSQKCFFQKHDTGGFPDAIKRMNITEATGGGGIYFYVTDLAGIIGCVQMGVMEFHIWGSRVDSVEKPDRLIFDLDPDVGLDFTDVRKAAVDVRDRLDALGLRTFPMVTGGKGIHVVAPIERRAAWPDVKAFAKEFAARLAAEAPDRYTANMAKAKRHGRIFVDYLRNERGATAITPYSTRARSTAPVAVPVTWEAGSLEAANLFGVKEVIARLRDADPWADYFGVRQSITKRMLEKVAAA